MAHPTGDFLELQAALAGEYSLQRELGRGGMGIVYLARDVQLDRDVAIKVLPMRSQQDEAWLARFRREARALASLNHPGIASVFGLEEHKGGLAIVMELAEGVTLAERIARGPIPASEALQIALGIADALEHAHEKGIIHRDLKPANVKVAASGAHEITLALPGGAQKIVVPAGTPIVRSVPGTRADLVTGEYVFVSAQSNADGALVAQRVQVSKDGVRPPQ